MALRFTTAILLSLGILGSGCARQDAAPAGPSQEQLEAALADAEEWERTALDAEQEVANLETELLSERGDKSDLEERLESLRARLTSALMEASDWRAEAFEWKRYAKELEETDFDLPSTGCIVDPSDCDPDS